MKIEAFDLYAMCLILFIILVFAKLWPVAICVGIAAIGIDLARDL